MSFKSLTGCHSRGVTVVIFIVSVLFAHKTQAVPSAALQHRVENLLTQAEPIEGAIVVLNPSDSSILAFAETHPGVATRADYPAASVFKLVTTTALLSKGLQPQRKVCYHGGLHGLTDDLLEDDKKRDTLCVSLAQALGASVNVVFGKLAFKWLDAADLSERARAFGFDSQLLFKPSPHLSKVEIPRKTNETRLPFAKAAAGFSGSTLSTVHGALIASAIANHGQMVLADGSVKQVMSPREAKILASMMTQTVTLGTSKFAFYDPKGRPYLTQSVAGKTGTLHVNEPFRAYNWWVGFAPVDRPTIAMAILLVNPEKWKMKPSTLARILLQTHFKEQSSR